MKLTYQQILQIGKIVEYKDFTTTAFDKTFHNVTHKLGVNRFNYGTYDSIFYPMERNKIVTAFHKFINFFRKARFNIGYFLCESPKPIAVANIICKLFPNGQNRNQAAFLEKCIKLINKAGLTNKDVEDIDAWWNDEENRQEYEALKENLDVIYTIYKYQEGL